MVVAFDFFPNNFEMTTILLLYSGDKDFEKLQQIITSTKAANFAKCITSQIMDLAIMTKKKQLSDRQLRAKSNEECFHYSKKEYYTKDYHSKLKQKPEDKKTMEESNRT